MLICRTRVKDAATIHRELKDKYSGIGTILCNSQSFNSSFMYKLFYFLTMCTCVSKMFGTSSVLACLAFTLIHTIVYVMGHWIYVFIKDSYTEYNIVSYRIVSLTCATPFLLYLHSCWAKTDIANKGAEYLILHCEPSQIVNHTSL